MKPGNILLLVGAGAAVLYFTQLGVAAKTANFVFQSVDFLSATKLRVGILCQNVSNADVTVLAMDGSITLNNNFLGTAYYFGQPVEIAPASQQVIYLTIDLSVLSIPGTVVDLLNNPTQSFSLQVKGSANVNHIVIPFTVNQSVTV